MSLKWRDKAVAAAVFYCGFLQLCGAVKLHCTVTQSGSRTTYNICHDFADFPSDISSFEYSYSDTSDTVLANQEKSTDPVKNHSINTLVSSRCIPTVHFEANSFSEGRIETEYTSTCSTNCSVGALSSVTGPQSQKNETAPSSSHEPTGPEQDGTGMKIALGLSISIVILVLAALFLCWKCRDRIHRMLCQGGVLYRAVNRTNDGAQVVQV